jgi:HAD superfamily hydrolase (TIGR01509 family)
VTLRAVLWDIDGTLVLSEPFHLRTIQASAAEQGIELPDSFHLEMVGRSAEETYILICERYGLQESFAHWIERKYRRYLALAEQIPGRPGAIEAFRTLRAAGIPQALVSNSDRIVVEANIRTMGLIMPRLVTVTINDVRLGKPEPEPYLRAAYLLGVEPTECLVVEDSPTGVQAGLNAGMRVLAWPESAALSFPPAAEIVTGSIGSSLARLGLPVEPDDR